MEATCKLVPSVYEYAHDTGLSVTFRKMEILFDVLLGENAKASAQGVITIFEVVSGVIPGDVYSSILSTSLAVFTFTRINLYGSPSKAKIPVIRGLRLIYSVF